MPRLPTILVAGGGNLYVPLLDPFPPTICTIAYVESLSEALDQAADASIVVVDSRLDGGGVDLCRRLRSDPVTSKVPLVLRVLSRGEHIQALSDARVLESDFDGLVKTMRQLCPELKLPPPADGVPAEDAPDDNYFDDGPTTVLFRRPEAAPGKANEWPPPPPVRADGQDLLAFTLVYSGYMNSLLEVMEAPAKLSSNEVQRLHSMVALMIGGTDQYLIALQVAITEALVGKDLEQMKILSSAKNSIYDKLQQARAFMAKLPTDGPPGSVLARINPTHVPRPPGAPPPLPAASVAASGAPVPLAARKSELTRAAEAKEAAAAAQAAAEKAAQKTTHKPGRAERHQRPSAPPKRPAATFRSASARKEAALPGRSILWIVALVVLLGGGLAFYFFYIRSQPQTSSTPKNNQPPVMKWVQIEQTPAAIIARAEAEDHERDPIVFMFRWLVNGQEVEGERTARLLPQSYHEGDTVQLEIRPADGYQTGAPLLSKPLVAAPTARPQSPAVDATRR